MPCLCLTTRQAARSLTRLYEDHLAAANLTPPQFGLLSVLAQHPGLSQSGLAAAVDLDQTTLSRNLQPLLRNRWLKCIRSREDRRQTLYTLTPAGVEARQAALPHWQKAQDHMRKALGPNWETALSLLQQLSAAASS